MKRWLLALSMVCSLIGVLVAAAVYSPVAARAAIRHPKPSPTPVGFAYDEITRTAFMPATPPPPGSFAQDYERLIGAAGGEASAAAPPSAQPTAAARRGMGGMFGHILGGVHLGMPSAQNPMGIRNPLLAMSTGTLKRYTYYWARGWVRVDDPLEQTATITKCAQHQVISLDLAHKTYRIVETGRESASAAPHEVAAPQSHGRTLAPGSAVMQMTGRSEALGPKTLEGLPTTGYHGTMTMSITQATGSCHDSTMQMDTVEYLSRLHKPRAYCPLSAAPVMGPGMGMGTAGGCRLKIGASTNGLAGMPQDRLAMYKRMTMQAGDRGASGPAFVTERGHVVFLYTSHIEPLFEIPPGFTRVN